jgi:hypothetical protein
MIGDYRFLQIPGLFGRRTPLRFDGSYREGTVNYLVIKRLGEMAEMAREFQIPLR